MYLATRGSERLVEGQDLEQVVKHAEAYMGDGRGDIIVWEDEKTIACEIEDVGEDSISINYRKM